MTEKKGFSPLCIFGPITDKAGWFNYSAQLKEETWLSSDYPASLLNSLCLYVYSLLCMVVFPKAPLCFPSWSYSYEPLGVSALAAHTLSITLTTGSLNDDNTNIQKCAQSRMGGWPLKPLISINIHYKHTRALKSHAYVLFSLCTAVPDCSMTDSTCSI